MAVLSVVLAAVLAYLIGSINFAIITSKAVINKDIREFGSGNAGMTNVLRILGKWPAVAVTVCDFLKGVVSILLGRWIAETLGGEVPFYLDHIVALTATLGHAFPVFFRFKGGKCILISAGIILVTHPVVLLIMGAVFLALVLTSRIVSLGSIAAAAVYPVLVPAACLITGAPYVVLDTASALVRAAFVIWLHRANIKRLMNGTENRFGQKKA